MPFSKLMAISFFYIFISFDSLRQTIESVTRCFFNIMFSFMQGFKIKKKKNILVTKQIKSSTLVTGLNVHILSEINPDLLLK